MANTLQILGSIEKLSAAEWNTLAGDYPFLKHQFLSAMETSGSVCSNTGWTPQHFVARCSDSGKVLAIMPSYLKDHSYGEYVFDWGWADAYHRNRLTYYPKLISAVPFTPCVGPRLLVAPTANDKTMQEWMTKQVIDYCVEHQLSSWHVLFPEERLPEQTELLTRTGVQFKWFNEHYQNFDEFLATMTSRKRKSIRKERETVRQQGIEFQWLEGNEISPEHLEHFYVFYHATYMKRGQKGYLTQDFFHKVVQSMPDNIFLVMARKENRPVASALFFKGGDTLYGRYWGCLESFNQLHFETCYYQGIDYCIQKGLKRFDSGAQGEHKIQRGFRPVNTYSRHWIAHPEFKAAIGEFLREEHRHVDAYRLSAEEALPFKRDLGC